MVEKCPADNTQSVEQDNFWTDVRSGNLDAHHIGWIICGAAAVVTVLLSFITILGHARNYNRPLEQRQIIRVLLLAPVYAIVSFFSYRFFRSYTYFSLAETAYEAFAIAAFLILMLQYIGDSVEDQRAVFMEKDKKPLPFPFCCWRFRPAKPYFLVVIKFSVVQYVVISPALTIAGIVLEYYELLCESSLSYKYGHVYILGVDFVSISVALYGLIVLYALIKKDLEGKKPLAKFMTIKMAIFFIFYQTFVFDLLQDRGVIKATQYWTATNVSDGLNALCITLEMVIIAAFQMWAFNWKEYHLDRIADRRQAFRGNALSKKGKTPVFRSLLHALNFADFFVELWHSIRFAIDRMRGKDYTRSDKTVGKFDIVGRFHGDGDETASKMGDLNEMTQRTGTSAQIASTNGTSFDTDPQAGHPYSYHKAYGSVGSGQSDHPYSAGNRMRRPSHDPSPLGPVVRGGGQPDLHIATGQMGHEGAGRADEGLLSAGALPAGSSLPRPTTPRSPRESTGRYPSFLFSSTNPADGTLTPPRAITPDGRRAPSFEMATPPPQPLPPQPTPSTWQKGGAYRVAGFPRASFIEAEADTTPQPMWFHSSSAAPQDRTLDSSSGGHSVSYGPAAQAAYAQPAPTATRQAPHHYSQHHAAVAQALGPQTSAALGPPQYPSSQYERHAASLAPPAPAAASNVANESYIDNTEGSPEGLNRPLSHHDDRPRSWEPQAF